MININRFSEIFEKKYRKEMPVYKFFFEFPDSKIEDLEEMVQLKKLKITHGLIKERVVAHNE